MDVWSFQTEEEEMLMTEPVTAENCGSKLALVRHIMGLSRRDLARALGCSESTLSRLESKVVANRTFPTTDFMVKLDTLQKIGFARFSKMSASEKAKMAESVVAAGGAGGTALASIGAIGAGGSVAGFSAAGITSGLAALGGTMLGGVVVVAGAPIVIGAVGYFGVKGIKALAEAGALRGVEVDSRWEVYPTANAGGA